MRNKYIQIYKDIVDDITKATYQPQTLLPSEHELMDKYGTSRETIRKALTLLAQNGFIQKVQGKGSIVLDTPRFDFPISGLVSFKELANQLGENHKTIVEKLELLPPTEDMKGILQIDSSEEMVWEVQRVREIDDEKIILDKDYIKSSKVEKLSREVCASSIYEYIEGELGLTISFAKKEITVEEPTKEDRNLLDLEGFSNVVVVKNYVYLEDASIFQYTESRHRPDKFRFVDFARRTKN
ncbi:MULTISPECIES: trehalose operon repressor [Bacillaceae]|uniref:Trehalose operon repressor n=1 Tax=Evansella alkalicola TaxID=745819 RepID=A0ABS6JMS7_9BACI|nr:MULTISPECIES: trehalose operon repressor [Bacillaceae]MBU9719854.1 trehalose operon repressor [Bacillus alkalicola]